MLIIYFMIIMLFAMLISTSIISASIIKPKLCINCKFYTKENIITSNEFGKCKMFPKDNNNIYFLVDGINKEDYYYCSVARKYDSMCGKEGKFYEKK